MVNSRKAKALVATILATVTLGGGLVAHNQVQSGASRTTLISQAVHLQIAAADKAPIAPYLGPFARNPAKGKVCGPEVRLMEGALRLTTPPVRIDKARNCVGIATENQLKKFQRRHKIPPSGIYGLRTHKALSHAYTDKQRADLAYIAALQLKQLHYTTILTITAHAQALQGLMQYCDYGSLSACGRRWQWPPYPDVPRHTDCSGFVTWVYYQSGLPDPNGNTFHGGFTGTLVVHGLPVKPGGPLHVGDLIFNGPDAAHTTHVSIYIGHGLTEGHGRAGIQIHAYAYRPVVAIRRYF